MADNNENLLKEIRENAIHKHPTYKGWRGCYADLQYCGYSQLLFLWRVPCSVKIILAFAPTEVLERELLENIDKMQLEHINKEVFSKIWHSINNFYKIAYNFEGNKDFSCLRSGVPINKTGGFIKGVIEVIDLMRYHSDKTTEKLLK